MRLSKLTKAMMTMAGAAALVMILAATAILRSPAVFPFALGVLIMTAVNIFKIFLLERTVNATVGMDNIDTGKNYVRLQYLLRYFITGVVLLAVGLLFWQELIPEACAWGAVIGVFTLQISVMIVRHMKFDDEQNDEQDDVPDLEQNDEQDAEQDKEQNLDE